MGDLEAVSVGIVIADVVARPVRGAVARGTLALVDQVALYSGGSAASTGYSLARFGVPTAVIGRIGTDGFGDFLVGEAARHGAENLLIRDPHAATSATQVLVDEDSERTFIHAFGANARLTPSDVPLEALRRRGVRLLHLAGIFALPGMDTPDCQPARALLEDARRRGITTSLDNVWDATGRWSRIVELLPHTDIFCPSIHDARLITKQSDPRAVAEKLFDLGVNRIVALKMGDAGSFVMNRDGESHHLGILSVPALDGTGSGDAFIAGFLAGWLRSSSLETCARLGNAAGAMCVQALGAMPGIGDWEELQRLAADVPPGQS